MAQQTINVGAAPNDGTGTPLRTAFQYTNSNFTELYTALGGGSGLPGASGQLIFNNGTSLAGDNELFYNATTNTLTTEKLIVPGNTQVAGSLSNLYVGSILNPTLFANTNTKLVGIGTATPADSLHIFGAGNALIEGTAGIYAKAITKVGAKSWQFGYRSGTLQYEIQEDGVERYTIGNGGTPHTWYIGASTAMTLNSTGLGVGGPPAGGMLLTVGATSSVSATANALQVLSSKGTFNVVADGSTNAAGTTITYSWANGGQGPLIFRNAAISNVMTLDASGNVGIGVTPAGTGGCLQLKSGITFPATQVASSDANTLDDYEEGTFTPTIVGTTAAGVGTYTTQVGRYTKVGDLVTIQIYLDWTAHTGTGNMNIGALPFGFVNAAGVHSGASFGYVNGIAMTAGNILTGYGAPANNFITLNQTPTGGGASNTVPIDVAGSIIVTMTYKT